MAREAAAYTSKKTTKIAPDPPRTKSGFAVPDGSPIAIERIVTPLTAGKPQIEGKCLARVVRSNQLVLQQSNQSWGC